MPWEMPDADGVMCLVREVLGGSFPFLMRDFRGRQEWVMYNLPADHYLADTKHDLKGDR